MKNNTPETIGEMMVWLDGQGCDPCYYERGPGLYRAHVNRAGCFWAEADSPETAMALAIDAWENNGKWERKCEE